MKSKLTLVFFICITATSFAGGIPKTMPDDFAILYSSTGTDISNHHKVYISLTECKAESKVSYDAELTAYSFSIEKTELSTLYSALYTLNAFKLKYKVQKNKNRGGEEIIYTVAGKKYTIRNQGVFFILPKSLNHFNECVDLITACADRHRH